jgi:DNA-directed RNA polymerase specialized sigma24 family protein
MSDKQDDAMFTGRLETFNSCCIYYPQLRPFIRKYTASALQTEDILQETLSKFFGCLQLRSPLPQKVTGNL